MESLHVTKSYRATKDYGVDWTLELDANADTIDTSQWEVSPAGTLIVESTADDGKIAKIVVSAGTVGDTHKMVNIIETLGGQRDARTIYLTITGD